MEQAQLTKLIDLLYDKLVADVAARVQTQVNLGPVTDAINTAIDDRIQNWADTYLDDRIENWAENNLDLEEAAREAVDNLDLGDRVRDIIRNDLTFSVSVD